MFNIIRKFLLVAGGLLALAGLLALIALSVADPQKYRHRIEQVLSQVTGMQVEVKGPTRILLLPAPGLRLEDFHVRNGESEWLSASAMDLRIRIIPLLCGKVEIGDVELVEPNLRIERDAEGGYNFIPERLPGDSEKWKPLKTRRFRAQDADMTFTDQKSGEQVKIESCKLLIKDLEWKAAASKTFELNMPDFRGNLSCGKIIYDELEAIDLQVRASCQDRRLEISPITSKVLGGRLKGRLESDFSGNSPNHSLELELSDFRVERFVQTFREDKGAEGLAVFTAQLRCTGTATSDMVGSLSGRAKLSGTEFVLYGVDMDKQLARYESTQAFKLVDVVAFFVAGPIGMAVTKGYGFASIFADTGSQTLIRELISEWKIVNGIAQAHDVAMSTAENRIALVGGLDFVNLQFKNMRVAVIDVEGCALVEQKIQGKFHDPVISDPNFLVTLAGPFIDTIQRGISFFTDYKCETFYAGRIESP